MGEFPRLGALPAIDGKYPSVHVSVSPILQVSNSPFLRVPNSTFLQVDNSPFPLFHLWNSPLLHRDSSFRGRYFGNKVSDKQNFLKKFSLVELPSCFPVLGKQARWMYVRQWPDNIASKEAQMRLAAGCCALRSRFAMMKIEKLYLSLLRSKSPQGQNIPQSR